MLPDIDLLVLNTYGTGIDVGELCKNVRGSKRGLPILHIGSSIPEGLPADVPTLSEDFNADGLLQAVGALIQPGPMGVGSPSLQVEQVPARHPNGRQREDSVSRPAVMGTAVLPDPVPIVRD